LPSASTFVNMFNTLTGFTYRGLTPHKFTPMPGVHIILAEMGPSEYGVILLKTFFPGLIIGVICCINALGVTHAATEVPRVLPETFTQCVLALFVISVGISIVM